MDSKQTLNEPDGLTIRLRFARREPAIWLAHLDLMRTFERSIRRAGLPVSYSHGFNPRPQLSFALPIGTGLATRDDYVDISLTAPANPAELMASLNRTLPEGLEILAAAAVHAEGSSLMSQVRAADYCLQGTGVAAAARTMAAMPEGLPWPVEKNSKGKKIVLNVRPLVIRMDLDMPDEITIRVKAGSSENLRPDLFLEALVRYGGMEALAAADTAICRLHLLVAGHDSAELQSPLPLPDGN